MPADPGTGTPLDDTQPAHASGEWERLMMTLRTKIRHDLNRTRAMRRAIRKGH